MTGILAAEAAAGKYGKPCGHYLGAQHKHCGATPTRAYIQGPRCKIHTPAALAGQAEPQPGLCAPKRCLCGQPDCPAYETYALRDRWGLADTIIDARAVAAGNRRSSTTEYRDAQSQLLKRQDHQRSLRNTRSEGN